MNETTAPPTIAVDNKPEACVVWADNPLTDKEKMMANITELQTPTAIIVHMAMYPAEDNEANIRAIESIDKLVRTIHGFTDLNTMEPKNRPTNIPPQ